MQSGPSPSPLQPRSSLFHVSNEAADTESEIPVPSASMNDKGKLHIAICGAGISGMALAAFLSKSARDITVDVFESKSEARMTGVGIAVWRRYWDLLCDELDFERSYTEMGYEAPDWTQVLGPTVRKSDGPKPGIEFCALSHGPFIIPRPTMSGILMSKINKEKCRIRFDMRLLSYDVTAASGAIRLQFEDGTTSECDTLVGADGVFSRVRATMFAHDQGLALHKFSGQLAYRMSCPTEGLEPGNIAHKGFTIWCGATRHVTSNAMGSNIQLTAWENIDQSSFDISNTRVSEVSAETIISNYLDWEPDLVSLFSRVHPQASCWPIHVASRLPTFVAGRVILIGDAAHGMTPHQGLGAGQGIEDAFILSKLLSSANAPPTEVTQALAVYDQVRRPESQRVVDQSLANGLNFAFMQPGSENKSLEEIGRELNEGCSWLMEKHGCRKELARANALMESCFTSRNY